MESFLKKPLWNSLSRSACAGVAGLLIACDSGTEGDPKESSRALPGFYYVSAGSQSAQEWELFPSGHLRMRGISQGCILQELEGGWKATQAGFEVTYFLRNRDSCSQDFNPWSESALSQKLKIVRTAEFGLYVCAEEFTCRVEPNGVHWLRVEDRPLVGVLAGKDTTVPIGKPIRLYAANTLDEAATGWEWKIGRDGEFRRVDQPEISVTAPWVPDSAFPCMVRMTTASGASHLDTQHVSVVGSPQTAEAGEDRVVSIGDSVRLAARASDVRGLPLSFAWDIGGRGEFRTAGPDTFIIAPAQPMAALPCILRVSAGGVTTWDTVTIKVVLDPPVADAGKDTVIQIHDSLVLSGLGKDSLGRIMKHEWAFGPDGKFAEHAGGSARFPDLGIGSRYPAILRVTDDDGNVDADTAWVTVAFRTVRAAERGFNARGNFVQVLPNGDIAVGGKKDNSIWVGRFTGRGLPLHSRIFQRSLDKHGNDYHGERIDFDPQGNAVAASLSADEANRSTLTVTRIGPDGTERWRKTLTSATYRGSPAGVSLTGKSEALVLYNRDRILAVFDSLGTILWQKTLDSMATAGGVAAWDEGKCAVWGDTAIDGVPVTVIQQWTYGAGGRKNWQVILSGEEAMAIHGARKAADGMLFFGGFGGILKLAPDGTRLLSVKHSVHSEDVLAGIAASPRGGFLLVGWRAGMGTGNRPWAVRTDAGGRRIWSRDYPEANGFFNKVDVLPDGTFAVAGTLRGITDSEAWIALLDENGDFR